MSKAKQLQKNLKASQVRDEFQASDYARDGVSEAEILKMKECFDAFDVDKNGSLDVNEMRDAIHEMGMEMQSERLLKMVDECDANGDDRLQFDEFLEWMGIYDKSRLLIEDDKIEGLFAIATQGRSKIVLDDFKRLCEEVNAGYTPEELEEMLQAADMDKDDAINLQEFVHVVTKQNA